MRRRIRACLLPTVSGRPTSVAGAAVGAGLPKSNWTFGACSAPGVIALKYGFSLKPKSPASMFVGNFFSTVL